MELSVLPQQIVNGILIGAVYSLIALGYNMVYGVLRLINFAHGEVFMLGAYGALFTSWYLGFSPEDVYANPNMQGEWWHLAIMLLTAMVVCTFVGITIEFFAYRPLRKQPKIACLITAIGVSLFLQFGGALVLPNTPPPSICEQVNPFQGSFKLSLLSYNYAEKEKLAAELNRADDAFQQQFELEKKEHRVTNPFALSLKGEVLRKNKQEMERRYQSFVISEDLRTYTICLPKGQLVMLVTLGILLMILNFIVNRTSIGRGMRAVAEDASTASLMGINVNRIIVITFAIGSALAGAGGMMSATFTGSPLTTFYGLQPGLKAFVAAVLGGIGSISGAVLGGFTMGISETLIVWLGYSSYKDAIAFMLLILILLVKPNGLLGSKRVEKV